MRIEAESQNVGVDVKIADGVTIRCRNLILGDGVEIREGTSIWVYGDLEIGDLGFIGPESSIRGNHVRIGREFYCSGRLDVGGGGWRGPHANLTIGDYCVIHNNRINVNREVILGQHVGLSPDVSLITHGYWNSVFEGFPFTEGPIELGAGTIVGVGTTFLPDVKVGRNVVVGAGAVVTKSFPDEVVLGGVPAKVISPSARRPLTDLDRQAIFDTLVRDYREALAFRGLTAQVEAVYPAVQLDGASFDLVAQKADIPTHTALTDDFRDFVRRRGVWFYGRRFRSIP